MKVRLVDLTLPMFQALAADDVDRAAALLGLEIPPTFIERTEIWEYFIRLLTEHPEYDGWTMKAVVDGDMIVGNAGFKGSPNADGMVEIGYSIQPEQRRQGYAIAAVRALLTLAAADPRVRIVQAVVNPDNDASIAVVTRAGFTPHGDLTPPRDGRQLLFTHPPGI